MSMSTGEASTALSDGGTSARAPRASVLLVEDDVRFAQLVHATLRAASRAVEVLGAASLADASALLARRRFDLVLVDRGLPDGDGLGAVRDLAVRGAATPVVLLTADATASSAVEAMKAGAVDYLVKGPDVLERLSDLVQAMLATRPQKQDTRGVAALVGDSPAMESVRLQVRRYAQSRACVLVEGETGVGKELVARALHVESPRAGGPFVAVNCGALPEHLVESELFGHVRGAFTGAHRDHTGLVEHAERGTLFLDEVEDLPLALQGKLLRLLQESEYRPVGATRARRADVRIVAASNADLRAMVAERRFRSDLYYRLDVLRIVVPPLRERLDDLPALIAHLAAGTSVAESRSAAPFVGPTAAQLALLRAHPWPGNVRELANLVERAAVIAQHGGWPAAWTTVLAQRGGEPRVAEPRGVQAPTSAPAMGWCAPSAIESEREALLRLLERHRWRREAAARELGISRVTLWRRMRRAGFLPDGSPGPVERS
ncbi:MAG TPA: sigma-54 dependent transcriptional regulator [Candidatus Binatia bacterium]